MLKIISAERNSMKNNTNNTLYFVGYEYKTHRLEGYEITIKRFIMTIGNQTGMFYPNISLV